MSCRENIANFNCYTTGRCDCDCAYVSLALPSKLLNAVLIKVFFVIFLIFVGVGVGGTCLGYLWPIIFHDVIVAAAGGRRRYCSSSISLRKGWWLQNETKDAIADIVFEGSRFQLAAFCCRCSRGQLFEDLWTAISFQSQMVTTPACRVHWPNRISGTLAKMMWMEWDTNDVVVA